MWKITVHFESKDLTYTVINYQERDGRILFVDSVNGMAKNFPYHRCSIEEVKQ